MLHKEKRRAFPNISLEEKMSTLSRLLRILIRINVFPFKADFQKRKLSFAFCSRPTFIYAFVVFALLSMQFISQGEGPSKIILTFHLMNNIFSGVIGYAEVFGFWWNINSQADGTDLISLFGSFVMLQVIVSSFLFILKNAGKYETCRLSYLTSGLQKLQ